MVRAGRLVVLAHFAEARRRRAALDLDRVRPLHVGVLPSAPVSLDTHVAVGHGAGGRRDHQVIVPPHHADEEAAVSLQSMEHALEGHEELEERNAQHRAVPWPHDEQLRRVRDEPDERRGADHPGVSLRGMGARTMRVASCPTASCWWMMRW